MSNHENEIKEELGYTELINSYIKLGYPIEEAIEKVNLYIQNNPDWNITND
tara:strand:- start:62 stop:214 length:153 start_codon:yes stop_codon:yes gene_type:complete